MFVAATTAIISVSGLCACYIYKNSALKLAFFAVTAIWVAFLVVFYLDMMVRLLIVRNSELNIYPNSFAAGVVEYNKSIFYVKVSILMSFISQGFLLLKSFVDGSKNK